MDSGAGKPWPIPPHVQLEGFLAVSEHRALLDWVLGHEAQFRPAKIVHDDANRKGFVDPGFRVALTTRQLGPLGSALETRMLDALPKLEKDLAALLHPKPAEEIARLYGRSQALGAGRAAGQALLLADALYGTLAGLPDLRHALAADGRTRWLYHIAMRQLSGRREPVEPTARTGGTMAIHLSQFFLLGGPAFKASELVRQVRAALASKLSG